MQQLDSRNLGNTPTVGEGTAGARREGWSISKYSRGGSEPSNIRLDSVTKPKAESDETWIRQKP